MPAGRLWRTTSTRFSPSLPSDSVSPAAGEEAVPVYSVLLAASALCLMSLPGPVVRSFEPIEPYGGHWGVDVAVPAGSVVRSPIGGVVTFAGTVAGTATVTVRSGVVRVSLSYLDEIVVQPGTAVLPGDPVGRSGFHDGHPAIHLSVRVGATYIDPEGLASCRSLERLRLLPPMLAPPTPRFDPATRTLRRHIRPPARRTSGDRPGGMGATRRRRGHLPAGR